MRRRDFLYAGALPFAGARGKSCIVLRLTGGPSQLDTWDMKPDAPSEIRGPYRPIRTSVPGIEISEIFPRMARHADKYAIIRSVYHNATTHEAAAERMFGPLRVSRARVVDLEGTWDSHGWEPFSSIGSYRDVCGPAFDLAYSSLLEDLSRRGLLESTLVVAMGEFGRTPKINPDGGRDHWPHCFSILLAGGGIRGGQVYGSSDSIGAEPRDRPVTPGMLAATVHKALGVETTDLREPPVDALLAG